MSDIKRKRRLRMPVDKVLDLEDIRWMKLKESLKNIPSHKRPIWKWSQKSGRLAVGHPLEVLLNSAVKVSAVNFDSPTKQSEK